MNKDILKEYFERQERVDLAPRDDFKERLIQNLNNRIQRLEQRRRYYIVMLIMSAIAGAILLIRHYLPLIDISMPTIDMPPVYIVLTVLVFVIISIASYQINAMELRELKRQLLSNTSNTSPPIRQ